MVWLILILRTTGMAMLSVSARAALIGWTTGTHILSFTMVMMCISSLKFRLEIKYVYTVKTQGGRLLHILSHLVMSRPFLLLLQEVMHSISVGVLISMSP